MNVPRAQVGMVAGAHRQSSVGAERPGYNRPYKNESNIFSHHIDDPNSRQPLKRKLSEQRVAPSSTTN